MKNETSKIEQPYTLHNIDLAPNLIHNRLCFELVKLARKHSGKKAKDVPGWLDLLKTIETIEKIYPETTLLIVTEYLNETGLYQSVEDHEIEFARKQVSGDLQLLVDDYYNGRRIEKVTFEETIPEDIKLNTRQAVLFHLSPPCGHIG